MPGLAKDLFQADIRDWAQRLGRETDSSDLGDEYTQIPKRKHGKYDTRNAEGRSPGSRPEKPVEEFANVQGAGESRLNSSATAFVPAARCWISA